MLTEIFSDYFAHKKNLLTNIDARIKLIFVALIMLVNLVTQQIALPIVVTSLTILVLLSIKIPLKIILLRLVSPLVVALVVLFIQIFFFGFAQGLSRGIFIVARIIAAVSLVLLLSMSTPVNKLFNTLRWFKVPLVWIEIGLLIYRYIFVFLEDAISIKNAQKLRLGYSGYRISKKSIGVLAGSIFIRAYDQAVNTFQAMLLRGYGGYKNDTDKKY